MMAPHRCVERVSHSNITVHERGRRANFPNPARESYLRVRVDDCLVTAGPRADWIITKEGVGSVVLELKGRDVQHACEQVFVSLVHADCQPWLEERRALLIVCAKYPAYDTGVQRAQERARQLGVRLKVVCNQAELDLESLV